MVPFNNKILRVVSALFLMAACVQAAPFAKTFKFTQPDGTRIEIWGEGDEFRAVFEHNGYTVVMDAARKTYTYARLSADGTELIPTRLDVGKADPQANGLPQHLRITSEAALAQAQARFDKWDAGLQVTRRWQARKSQLQLERSQAEDGRIALAPPAYTTTGTKVGLCLLIDFPDDVATVPHADIIDFCNADEYTGYGNNGSVKEYYKDVSNGLLTYTNIVTAYIRMARPKTYYNDISKDCGSQGNLLIEDAVAILKASPNYATEIAPAFENLTVDDVGQAVACNVFYAGDNGGRWTYGLWPHSWSLVVVGAQALTASVRIWNYQITNIGESLELGTFCHENGHMLCDYPDIYDYGYDSKGGAGMFCLMDYGGGGGNPVQVCAYLKYASGWATNTVEVTADKGIAGSLSALVGAADYNRFYRFEKPGTPTEYYLFENRQKTGRDAGIPASGIAIWHIDELGKRDDQRLAYNTKHENYECTLMQADNQWHFQKNVNAGDARDLYYFGNAAAGYGNAFSDSTAPSARWWDGTKSLMEVDTFSASGPVMTLLFETPPPVIVTPSPLPDGRIGTFYSFKFAAGEGATPYVWKVVSNTPPSGLILSEAGVLSGLPEEAVTAVFDVAVTGSNGKADTNQFSLTVWPAFNEPYVETYENSAGLLPDGWAQEYVSNTVAWTYVDGNGAGVGAGSPFTAHNGTYNACLKVNLSSLRGSKTRLVSPRIVFRSASRYAQLSFWHYMAKRDSLFQDELRVLYKTSYTNEWQTLETYTDSVNVWTRRTVPLPGSNTTYYIAFEGTAKYGYGIHIDDVEVFDAYTPLEIVASSVLPDAILKQPYSYTLEAAGNEGPFTFSLTAGTALPEGLTLSTNGLISGVATNLSNLGSNVFSVALTDGETNTVSSFSLNVGLPRFELFAEPFEQGGMMPTGWTQVYVTNGVAWACRSGGGNGDTFHQPPSAYEGLHNAVLWINEYTNHVTRLVSPVIDLGASPANIRLDFWHCMTALMGQQDELRVYYKTSASGAWNLLANYTNNVTEWTRRTLPLPNPTRTYYLAFEGNARFGQGVCMDDIRITDESLAPIIMTTSPLPDGTVGEVYSKAFTALGGVTPYKWDLVSGTLPSGLVFSVDGILSGMPEVKANVTLGVRVKGADGYASTNLFALKVSSVQRIPYTQTFESRSQLPPGWSQEFVGVSTLSWRIHNGGYLYTPPMPNAAHSGTNNALLTTLNNSDLTTRLVTPIIDMGVGTTNAQLSFWFCSAKKAYQDELKVLYKTNATDTSWMQLTNYTKSVTAWSNIVLSLPSPSPSYLIAFEGLARGGYGICIDDVQITGQGGVLSPYEQWKADNFGLAAGNELIAGDEADPDNDGIVNWREYAMALDPLTPDAEGLPAGDVASGYLTLTYRENQAATDVRFEVEACNDLLLQNWTTNNVSEISRADSNLWWQVMCRHDVPVTNAPQGFLRLKLTWPMP